jgi:hypothetical protein
MVTSRFQLGLIATLAVGLGFSLSSSEAIGYPAGAAVSLGTNPISSRGGDATTTPVLLFEAGAGGPFIIADVVLTQQACNPSTSNTSVTIETAEGDVLAKYNLASDTDNDGGNDDAGSAGAVVAHAYTTGVAVASGTAAYITTSGSCNVFFSISGYQAHG